MVMPLLTGRGVSAVRTPMLIRDYLAGQGVFADDPPEELAQRRAEGAYVAQIHQRIKQYIRESHPKYQWPRRHSFHARINDLLMLGLLVETGRREEPQQRGAGRLRAAAGFSQRVWVRLAPEAATRAEWADPLGYLVLLKQREDPSSYQNIRTSEQLLAMMSPPVTQPVMQRRPAARPLAQPVTTVSLPVTVTVPPVTQPVGEAPERLTELEEERQALHEAAETLLLTGISPNAFARLVRHGREFNTRATRAYGRTPFPDLAQALDLLQSCVAGLAAEGQLSQQRAQALNFCRNAARLVAEAVSRPLVAPAAPRPAPPAGGDIVRQAFDRLVDSRPNSAFATRTLDRLEAAGVDVREARDALEEYTAITRSDYEGGSEGTEEYREAREEAWTAFLKALENTEEIEEEEGE